MNNNFDIAKTANNLMSPTLLAGKKKTPSRYDEAFSGTDEAAGAAAGEGDVADDGGEGGVAVDPTSMCSRSPLMTSVMACIGSPLITFLTCSASRVSCSTSAFASYI